MSGALDAPVLLVERAVNGINHPPGSGVAAFFLALIFAWSAAVKLREPYRAAVTLIDFGVSDRLRPALAVAVGSCEATLAVAIAIAADAVIPLAAAALLLGTFGVLIARSLVAGKRFSCFCFGDENAELSLFTLGRTVALAVLAVLLLDAAVAGSVHEAEIEGRALEFVAAIAVLAMMALVSRFPSLVRWNSHRVAGSIGR